MWGENSKNCENNCQCSGLITENFKINSGNNATKRKQETAFNNNYKLKMNPHSLEFTSPSPPKATPSKRRILGELQNFKPTSPLIDRFKSPKTSPVMSPFKSPLNLNPLPLIDRLKSPPLNLNPLNIRSPMISPLPSLASPLLNSPIMPTNSPLSSRHQTSKISKLFEDRTRFKMENKENEGFSNFGYEYNKEYLKIDLEETARDFTFGKRFQEGREKSENWSTTKLDFTDTLPTSYQNLVPDQPDLDDLDSLHDLEIEFENDTFEQCTKYEIISTDSPNVISRGRSTSRKICSRNFEFGAALAENEPSTSFNRPATRMLNFDDEDFEFTSPTPVKKAVSVKKSLKFSETPTKTLMRERSDSSIGSMSSSPSKLRIFTSESTASMESGFISEIEEQFLDIDESNSPKIANFNELLSGQIKENILTDRNFLKRPSLVRSLSFHPESKKVMMVSPGDEKRKREAEQENSNKRRRSNCDSLRIQRPVLQRALSENNASIKSALARSSTNSDLIGDYSGAYSLPLIGGDHEDLKSISCETLAELMRGQYHDSVPDFQVIDCRYPYEYEGGHINSAINLFTPDQIQVLVQSPPVGKRVLIFHCEFSIERGPKLSRALRSFDRSHNRAHYPSLSYPEVYLLHGGYRAFHNKHPALCTPGGYTPMLDPQHKHLLRRHRSLQGRNRLLL